MTRHRAGFFMSLKKAPLNKPKNTRLARNEAILQMVIASGRSGMTRKQLAEKFPEVTPEQLETSINNLRNNNRIHNIMAGTSSPAIWLHASNMGPKLHDIKSTDTCLTATRAIVSGVERTSMSDRPVYDGAELKPYTGRPGANDFKQWGSVVNGRNVPYAAPSIRRTA